MPGETLVGEARLCNAAYVCLGLDHDRDQLHASRYRRSYSLSGVLRLRVRLTFVFTRL